MKKPFPVVLTLLVFLFACQSAPVVKQSLTTEPASAQVKAASDHTTKAVKKIADTSTHLKAAQEASTLPAAKVEVAKAQESNQGAAEAVGAAQAAIVAAVTAVKAQEKAGAHCEAQLAATKSYEWLRVLIIAAGGVAAVALGILTLACMFASVASSTVLAAIPIIGGLVAGARGALLLAMAELAVAVATCAYLAAHIAAAVAWGFVVAAGTAAYLGLRAIGMRRLKSAGAWVRSRLKV